MINAVIKIVVFVLLAALNPAFASVVKMSSSGICHPPQSSWYDRTKNFQPFGSVEACLAAGGRLPKGIARPSASDRRTIKPSDSGSYSRTAFGHGWDDSDGDCQDSRAEALVQMSSTPVRFATDRRCRVVTGRWISPFSGNVIQNASEADIDHVVPLKWAWDRGANHWSDANRERFANDPVNLLPVEASLNRSKGAKGPTEWLPPSGQCSYVARFSRITKKYQLEPRPSETVWIQDFLQRCRS
ncbi:HNH endonuclease family protein [Marinobacter adhaerens]|nr:HNH endonuclease family protein [Marinobacter adhaerens]